MVYFLFILVAVISFLMGWYLGLGQGRHIGYMIGEELERRKWKRRTTR